MLCFQRNNSLTQSYRPNIDNIVLWYGSKCEHAHGKCGNTDEICTRAQSDQRMGEIVGGCPGVEMLAQLYQ